MKFWLALPLLLLLVTGCFGSVGITTSTVPNGTVGTTYSAAIHASGGCTPYKWSILSGSLPAGIIATTSSKTTSLQLSGTPTKATTYSFSVQVTGCGGVHVTKAYSIVVQSTANHVVDLSWNASTTQDLAGYNMYRAPDGVNWKKINASLLAATLYSDSTVANGSTYYYAATAVDIHGNESSKSTAIKVSVP